MQNVSGSAELRSVQLEDVDRAPRPTLEMFLEEMLSMVKGEVGVEDEPAGTPDSPLLGWNSPLADTEAPTRMFDDAPRSTRGLRIGVAAPVAGDGVSIRDLAETNHESIKHSEQPALSLFPPQSSMVDVPDALHAIPADVAVPRDPPARVFARPKRAHSQADLTRSLSSSAVALDIDPSIFPDPYPSHSWMSPVPALSSGSSNSARSSAYTSPGSTLRNSGDSGHVHVAVASSDEIGLGITSDEPIQTPYDAATFTRPTMRSKPPTSDGASRWSGASYSQPRSGDGEDLPQSHRRIDSHWSMDEPDSFMASTDDETDDEKLEEGDSFELLAPTQAALSADEGKGVILDLSKYPSHSIPAMHGVTHLLATSLGNGGMLQPYLMTALPTHSATLLALDISNNFFPSLPTSLSTLQALEELNVSGNPVRALPVFLTSLSRTLRIFLADNCGLSNMPIEMSSMKKLTVLSVRRNKFFGVPDCIAGMGSLEDLRLEGNPFLGPWKELMAPLIETYNSPSSPIPLTPAYSTSAASTAFSDEESPPVHEEDHTIRASLHSHDAQPMQRSFTAPLSGSFMRELGVISPPPSSSSTSSLTRTRTMPRQQPASRTPTPDSRQYTRSQYQVSTPSEEQKQHSIRRMRSANELRNIQQAKAHSGQPSPRVPQSRQHAQSVSMSQYGREAYDGEERPTSSRDAARKFGSMGRALGSATMTHYSEGQMSQSMILPPRTTSVATPNFSRSDSGQSREADERSDSKGKWGFFKKMSIRNLKTSEGIPASKHRPGLAPSMSTPNVPRVLDAPVPYQASYSNDPSRASTPLPIPPSPNPPPSSFQDDAGRTPLASLMPPPTPTLSPTAPSAKRRSFLPIDIPPSIQIPPPSPSMGLMVPTSGTDDNSIRRSESQLSLNTEELDRQRQEKKARALRTLFAYLQDMLDLGVGALSSSQPLPITPQPIPQVPSSPPTSLPSDHPAADRSVRSRRPTLSEVVNGVMSDPSFTTASSLSSAPSLFRDSESTTSGNIGPSTPSTPSENVLAPEERKSKDDKVKRAMLIREIVETEKTYVRGLKELMEIYIKPASMPNTALGGSSKETVVPAAERKVVFNGLDALYSFHADIFLPALEVAARPLYAKHGETLAEVDPDGRLSSSVAHTIADVFVSHAAFMKMYSTYINNFDSATQRLRIWTIKPQSGQSGSGIALGGGSLGGSSAQLASIGASLSGVAVVGTIESAPPSVLTTGQRKRIKAYLKRARSHPKHSQINLEGYLLLPIQRIPRYRLLLEELVRSTPTRTFDGREDVLDRALSEITSLATNMNEGKRDSESRRKLVQWQARIKGKFPSPLVQPHRRLIMDGALHLTRVVRRSSVPFEVLNSDGDHNEVYVECLTPEETPRELVGVLCNDLLVLCKDPSRGQNPTSQVELWAVLRMQTLGQPASVVSGSTLRIVDNKAILYFEAPSTSDALTWSQAINLHIPGSK